MIIPVEMKRRRVTVTYQLGEGAAPCFTLNGVIYWGVHIRGSDRLAIFLLEKRFVAGAPPIQGQPMAQGQTQTPARRRYDFFLVELRRILTIQTDAGFDMDAENKVPTYRPDVSITPELENVVEKLLDGLGLGRLVKGE